MTEVPKGLMTSKELGMAVADRLVQAEKRREVHGAETPPKQQTPMRRALQPPTAREQRADRDAAPAVHHSATQKILDEYQPGDWKNPEKSIWRSREAADEFYAKAYGHPPMTDAEWEGLQRIFTMSPAELAQKFGVPPQTWPTHPLRWWGVKPAHLRCDPRTVLDGQPFLSTHMALTRSVSCPPGAEPHHRVQLV